MRILHVISGIDPVGGGPASALMGLATAQVQAGLEVSVVATYAAGTDVTPGAQLREKGVAAQMVGPCGGLFFTHPQLPSILDEHIAQSDVVHVHSMWEDVQHQACRIAHKRGVPYIIRPCGMLDPWSLKQGWLKKRLYLRLRMRRNLDRAAAIHFASQTESDHVGVMRLGAPSIVEPNGIDLREFAELPPPGAFRARHPELGARPYIVYLGRLHRLKGLELLVPAFARARADGAMLVLAGPDSQGFRAEVEALVKENALDGRVIFTGLLRGSERVAALADATLFSLPSFHENFGIAVVEALAAGTPVVISDHVYIHGEISRAGVGGVVPLDVDALAAELTRWLGDEHLRRGAAERARAFACARYDWRNIAQRWVGHYQRIAGCATPSSSAASSSGPARTA